MKTLAVCAGLLAALLITACGFEPETTPGTKLRGTWQSNDPTDYSGTLTISISSNNNNINRIKINGYGKGQTPSILDGGDDNKRPFKDFTKDRSLEWYLEVAAQKNTSKYYSEEGMFFIIDLGVVSEGIPYTYYEDDYWEDNSSSTQYKARNRILCFTFGGRIEKLVNSD